MTKLCDVKSYNLSLHRGHPQTLHVLTPNQPTTSLPAPLYGTNSLRSFTINGHRLNFIWGWFKCFHFNTMVKFKIKYWIVMEMKEYILKRT